VTNSSTRLGQVVNQTILISDVFAWIHMEVRPLAGLIATVIVYGNSSVLKVRLPSLLV